MRRAPGSSYLGAVHIPTMTCCHSTYSLLRHTRRVLACLAALAGFSASAAVLYWDANGAANGSGGTGIWGTSAQLFRIGSEGGPLASWPNTDPNTDEVVLGGDSGAVTISAGASIRVNRMTVATNGYSLVGGNAQSNLVLSGLDPTIAVGTGSTLVLSAPVNGAALTLEGGGTLKLGASERLSNTMALTIAGGSTFELGYSETVGSVVLESGRLGAAMNENGSITAQLYQVQSGTITATMHGSGGLTKSSSGAVTISGNANNDYAGFTRVTGGRLVLAGSNALSKNADVMVDGGTLELAGFSQTAPRVSLINGSIIGSNTLTASDSRTAVYVENGQISAYLQANGGLTKGGVGTVVLTNTADMNNNAINVTGGNLDLTRATILNTRTVNVSGGVLSASGNQFQNADLTLSGGSISPGGSTSVGGMTVMNADWTANSGFVFNIWDATGAPGVGYDYMNASQTLQLKGLGNGKFTLKVIGLLSADGGTGLVSNFDPSSPYAWTFASANQRISGFNSKEITVDLSGFQNYYNGSFSVDMNSSKSGLQLLYTPVPEPQTYAALLACGSLLFAGVRTLRRRSA